MHDNPNTPIASVNSLSRRRFGGLAAAGLVAGQAREAMAAGGQIGEVAAVSGACYAKLDEARRLSADAAILEGDLVWTDADARASLDLDGGTHVHLGGKTSLKIDRFVANKGGELILGDGALVFDRDDDLPKTHVAVRSVFGLIAVRGTRFFAGPNRGAFAIFCERGEVAVRNRGGRCVLYPGDGVDLKGPGDMPGTVTKWGAARIDEAFATVMGKG